MSMLNMSMLNMSPAEKKEIDDSKVELLMDWAKEQEAEAEQLANDSVRLIASTTDRLDRLVKQNFFIRCWNRFNRDANSMERANVKDVIQMQKIALRYLDMLQDRELLMAHSLLSIKNNLYSLAIEEGESRQLIHNLAERTLERFNKLEKRVEEMEVSDKIKSWLITLDVRDYDKKYPKYIRLLRIINDFYGYKNDNWNYQDFLFLRKAITIIKCDPDERISLKELIEAIIEEINENSVGIEKYSSLISEHNQSKENINKFVIDNISSPTFLTVQGICNVYEDREDIINFLNKKYEIPYKEALKNIMIFTIENMNVNINHKLPLQDIFIEILGGIRLCNLLINKTSDFDINENCSLESISSDLMDKIRNIIHNYLNDLENCNIFLMNGVYIDTKSITEITKYSKLLNINEAILIINLEEKSEYCIIFTPDSIIKIRTDNKKTTADRIKILNIKNIIIAPNEIVIETYKKKDEAIKADYKNEVVFPNSGSNNFQVFRNIISIMKDQGFGGQIQNKIHDPTN